MRQAFAQVLRDTGDTETASFIEACFDGGRGLQDPLDTRRLQAISIVFQLLDIVEETPQIRCAAAPRTRATGKPIPGCGSITSMNFASSAFPRIPSAPFSPPCASNPSSPRIRPRPSAPRSSNTTGHIYLLLVERDKARFTDLELALFDRRLLAALERLWRTGEIFLDRPDVDSEVRNSLHYLRNVFPGAIELLDLRFQYAWNSTFSSPPPEMPHLSFGSWVGGDRDGHPFVTPELTAKTLLQLRDLALNQLQDGLRNLGSKLSLSPPGGSTPAALASLIHSLAAQLGPDGESALTRNPAEPWRQLINLIAIRLRHTAASSGPLPYSSPDELLRDLAVAEATLREAGASLVADMDVRPIAAQVRAFGFHLATSTSARTAPTSTSRHRGAARRLRFAGLGLRLLDAGRKGRVPHRELASLRPFAGPAHATARGGARTWSSCSARSARTSTRAARRGSAT
jgi:phosphoenolpyruvate carboxylase